MSDIFNLDALCRCCHADGVFKQLHQQYVVDDTVENYITMLLDTLGISIKPPRVNASYSICENCILQLRSASQFKKQVLECEAKFEEYCKNELSNYDIKTEPEYLDDNSFNSDDEKCITDGKNKNMLIEISLDVKPKLEDKPTKKKRKPAKGKSKTKPKDEDSLVVKVKTETGELFSCKTCGVSYEGLDELNRHINFEHLKGFKCSYCEEAFKSELKYKIHNRQEHGDTKPYSCQYCGKKIASRQSLLDHISTAHIKDKFYQCDVCQKKIYSKQGLRIHLQKHDGTFRKLICEQCGIGCNDRTNLRLHVMAVHEKIKLFQCKECGKRFSASKHLKVHIRSHTGERPFECDICPNAFVSRDSLTIHKRKHENNGYKCKTCGNVYATRGQYASHYRTHVGSKPYKCHLCNKEFAGKYSLNRHVFEHSGERPFVCPICNKDFKQKPQLVRHNKRFHNPEPKPAVIKEKCNICKRTVPNIERHMEAHTNKPFSCHLCEKRYPEQNALNRHLQRHSGIKPHKCELCDKGFIQLKSLKNHKLKVHKLPLKTEQEDHYDSLVTTYTIQNLKRK